MVPLIDGSSINRVAASGSSTSLDSATSQVNVTSVMVSAAVVITQLVTMAGARSRAKSMPKIASSSGVHVVKSSSALGIYSPSYVP